MRLLDRLCSDAVLERAFQWLCRQRRGWPNASDVWSFRRDWLAQKARLRAELRAGTFPFGLLDRIRREGGEEVEVFASRDWPGQLSENANNDGKFRVFNRHRFDVG